MMYLQPTPLTQMGCALNQLLMSHGDTLSAEDIEFLGLMIDKYEMLGDGHVLDDALVEQIYATTSLIDVDTIIEFFKLQYA